MIRRGVLLVVYLIGGYVLGELLAELVLLPVAAIKHLGQGLVHTLAVTGGLLGLLIGFGQWRSRTAPSSGWGVHGSARWATDREVRAALGGADGLIVGRENRKGGQLLRYAGQQHMITIAPTRSGKGVGAIIPNLLTADRAILCIDPKGEDARAASRPDRARGGGRPFLHPTPHALPR